MNGNTGRPRAARSIPHFRIASWNHTGLRPCRRWQKLWLAIYRPASKFLLRPGSVEAFADLNLQFLVALWRGDFYPAKAAVETGVRWRVPDGVLAAKFLADLVEDAL